MTTQQHYESIQINNILRQVRRAESLRDAAEHGSADYWKWADHAASLQCQANDI